MRLKWMGPWSRCLNRVGQLVPRGTFTTAAAQVAEYASKKPTPVPWGFFGAMRKLEIGFFILQKWFGTAPKYPKDSGLKLIVPICHRKDPSKKNSAAQEFDGPNGVVVLKLEGQQFGKTARRSRLR